MDQDAVLPVVLEDMEKLLRSGLMEDIVFPRADSHVELPFVLQKGDTIYSGRVDRILIKDGTAHVYDYKSFPVKHGEMPRLLKKYRFQMETYAEAIERLFRVPARAYLVFTHLPKVVPM
jgi:ATP-dependent exoDNAse (exonuclease V) beta subunit